MSLDTSTTIDTAVIDATIDLEVIQYQYERDGVAYIPQVFGKAEMDRLRLFAFENLGSLGGQPYRRYTIADLVGRPYGSGHRSVPLGLMKFDPIPGSSRSFSTSLVMTCDNSTTSSTTVCRETVTPSTGIRTTSSARV